MAGPRLSFTQRRGQCDRVTCMRRYGHTHGHKPRPTWHGPPGARRPPRCAQLARAVLRFALLSEPPEIPLDCYSLRMPRPMTAKHFWPGDGSARLTRLHNSLQWRSPDAPSPADVWPTVRSTSRSRKERAQRSWPNVVTRRQRCTRVPTAAFFHQPLAKVLNYLVTIPR